MSSYLNIYLAPKKTKIEYEGSNKKEVKISEGIPLRLQSWSRSTDVYQYFYELLSPAFIGTEGEPKYSKVSKDDLMYITDSIEKEIENTKNLLEKKKEAFKQMLHPTLEIYEGFEDFYIETNKHIEELQETLSFFDWLHSIAVDLEYSDFEEILINID